GVLVVVLRLIEYRWLVLEHSFEIYGGLIAALFAGVGIWLGLKLTRKETIVREVAVSGPFSRDDAQVARLGLTPRELEVLGLVAVGRSNREIAGELFISAKTASVHVSNILAKLKVASRGEAAATAHRMGIVSPYSPA
ncbi:MAG: helix-turn-helix domain-containing protein, partial [Actinoallomurus sp.]